MADTHVFRGQQRRCWTLQPSIERAFKQFDISNDKKAQTEWRMIREFRRKYRGDDRDDVLRDTLYCMGLMQHHFAPTRLLDFTYSPYVAAFFALEHAEPNDEPVVWCINSGFVLKTCPQHIKKLKDCRKKNDQGRQNDDYFKRMYLPYAMESAVNINHLTPQKFVLREVPYRIHERHSIQQGMFLCPGDVTVSFKDNLLVHLNKKTNGPIILKLIFAEKFDKKAALEDLRRMNVTRATLFPGLDGFAESLKQNMPFFSRT